MNPEAVPYLIGAGALGVVGFIYLWVKDSKKQKVELENTVIPKAPCGFDEDHYYWKKEGWPCPHCHRIATHKKKMADEDRMAMKIAKAMQELRMKDGHPEK